MVTKFKRSDAWHSKGFGRRDDVTNQMEPRSRGDSHMPADRAASTLNPGRSLWELTRFFAHVSALRIHDKSTALRVV